MDYRRRTESLKNGIKARKLDAFLVTNKANVSYMTGFPGEDSLLLFTNKKNFFITDSRYIEEARNGVKGYDVRLVRASTYDTIKALCERERFKRVGFEAMDLPYAVAARLKRLMGSARLVPTKGLVEGLRAIKDVSELVLIKKSIRLTKNTLEKVMNLVRPGATEEGIARKIELEFIGKGARAAFEPIVASGANSSKPHAAPTGARIEKNSFVMIDMGCSLNGYCSDITRMVVLGHPQERFVKLYNIVRAAQAMAIAGVRPGATVAEVDLIARRYIHKSGFGKYFGHAAGHGVGMEVHELPNISKMNEETLVPGMVFTVEPAIYIPGFGGVRIEDMILVTDKGCEVLT